KGRLIAKLDPERQADDDEAEYQDNEHGRPIAAIVLREVEPAGLAFFGHGQEAREEPPTPATRAFAPESGGERRDRRIPILGQRRITSSVDRHRRPGAAEDVDAEEEEQPHHVDEVPIPGGGLEAEMLIRLEVPRPRAEKTYGQENRADDDV